jgi:hypothetical protein
MLLDDVCPLISSVWRSWPATPQAAAACAIADPELASYHPVGVSALRVTIQALNRLCVASSPERVIATSARTAEPAKMKQEKRVRRLRQLDLRLLLIFQRALATGHAKVAAEDLELTQAAVSHALRRLSDVLGARLFVRCGGAVIPTKRAQELSGAVDSIIATAETLLSPEE